MAEKIPMLALSPTMEEGTIVKWVKNEGDAVAQGDVLCEVETDKATMEYQAQNEGTLLKILAPEGSAAGVGHAIAVIGQPGEDISALIGQEAPAAAKPKLQKPTAKEQGKEEPAPEEKRTAAAAGQPAEEKVRSTPVARKLAEKHGIDIASVKGSGPEGRITKEDVERAAARAAPAPAGAGESSAADETMAVSQKRRIIAQRLSGSMFSAPHYYLTLSAAADNVVAARENLNARRETKVSLNAFLMKFVAETLKRYPIVNSTWTGETIVKHASADIALAMSQTDGLIAPVVRDCGNKGIVRIDEELKVLIERAQENRLAVGDYANSTFTISNLGSFGIEQFTAIINPPNSAILAVGRVTKTPVVDENDHVRIRQVMKLTLSCDHRVIDGAVGAQFLRDLKEMIEYPIHDLY